MEQFITTASLVTLVLTWSFLHVLAKSPIDNRWLPLASLLIGIFIGVGVGYYFDVGHVMENLVLGAFAGANSTWLDQFIKHTIMGDDNK